MEGTSVRRNLLVQKNRQGEKKRGKEEKVTKKREHWNDKTTEIPRR